MSALSKLQIAGIGIYIICFHTICFYPLIVKSKTLTCSKGLFVLMPFPPQKTQLSLKPRLVIDVLPNSAMSRRASSLSLRGRKGMIQ